MTDTRPITQEERAVRVNLAAFYRLVAHFMNPFALEMCCKVQADLMAIGIDHVRPSDATVERTRLRFEQRRTGPGAGMSGERERAGHRGCSTEKIRATETEQRAPQRTEMLTFMIIDFMDWRCSAPTAPGIFQRQA